MKITTVEAIGRRFRELVADIDVHPYYKRFQTTPHHDGSPHIESDGEYFSFVVTERGQELKRVKSNDPEEILYMLLDGITQVAATEYELKIRVEGTDGREVWFPYQEQLLGALKPEWGLRKRREHERVLVEHPFDERAEPPAAPERQSRSEKSPLHPIASSTASREGQYGSSPYGTTLSSRRTPVNATAPNKRLEANRPPNN